MFCPKCGRINPDEAEICKGCNAQLHEEKEVVQKKHFPKVLTAILVVIAIVLSCFVITSITGCSQQGYDNDEEIEVVQF